jgi:hypothetical protein
MSFIERLAMPAVKTIWVGMQSILDLATQYKSWWNQGRLHGEFADRAISEISSDIKSAFSANLQIYQSHFEWLLSVLLKENLRSTEMVMVTGASGAFCRRWYRSFSPSRIRRAQSMPAI